MMIDYKKIITIDAGKRSGKPCSRHMRITVYDILKMLANGMHNHEIIEDFPELTLEIPLNPPFSKGEAISP